VNLLKKENVKEDRDCKAIHDQKKEKKKGRTRFLNLKRELGERRLQNGAIV
jgi:hypothetical protein